MIGRDEPALEVEGHLHLVLGGDVGGVLPEQRRDRGGRLGRGEHVELVGLGEGGVLPRAGDGDAHLLDRRVGGVGVPEPSVTDQPHADAARFGELESLDLAAERARLGLSRLLGVGLDGLIALRSVDRRAHQLAEVRHPFLPP